MRREYSASFLGGGEEVGDRAVLGEWLLLPGLILPSGTHPITMRLALASFPSNTTFPPRLMPAWLLFECVLRNTPSFTSKPHVHALTAALLQRLPMPPSSSTSDPAPNTLYQQTIQFGHGDYVSVMPYRYPRAWWQKSWPPGGKVPKSLGVTTTSYEH